MPNYVKKMIPSAVILVLDLILIALIPSQVKELTHDLVTTRFMPYVVTILIAACSAVDLIQTFIKERPREAGSEKKVYFEVRAF